MEERISDADRLLQARLMREIEFVARLKTFVMEHLMATYGLQPGDTLEEDGTIVRTAPETPG